MSHGFITLGATQLDDSAKVLEFLARPDAEKITQVGAATPDHPL